MSARCPTRYLTHELAILAPAAVARLVKDLVLHPLSASR